MATIDIKLLENSLPDSLKLIGFQKIGNIILEKGIQINDQIQPPLDNILSDLLLYSNKGNCPTDDNINSIILKRNNIVEQLNKIEKNINSISNAIGITSDLLNGTLDAIKILNTTKTILSISQIPLPAASGQILNTISNIGDIVNNLKFDPLGSPKLEKLKNIIDSTAAPISITSNFITKSIIVLNNIDLILKKCSPNLTITPISPNLVQISDKQIKASQTINDITYKGFIIEIETIKYSPNINRIKAVGKNSQGIVLIQTELSFTTNPQTLINELKLIIDRDNLKAY